MCKLGCLYLQWEKRIVVAHQTRLQYINIIQGGWSILGLEANYSTTYQNYFKAYFSSWFHSTWATLHFVVECSSEAAMTLWGSFPGTRKSHLWCKLLFCFRVMQLANHIKYKSRWKWKAISISNPEKIFYHQSWWMASMVSSGREVNHPLLSSNVSFRSHTLWCTGIAGTFGDIYVSYDNTKPRPHRLEYNS